MKGDNPECANTGQDCESASARSNPYFSHYVSLTKRRCGYLRQSVDEYLPFRITDEQKQSVLNPDGSKLPRKHLIADPILIVILNLGTV